MEIVLPAWALTLDTPLRALVLRHEEEHRRARDPALILFTTVMASLLPWHAALWWQASRLRLAIEMDCDARVLRTQPESTRYGLLLLAIAQQRSNNAALLGAALSERTSNLERRIVAMRTAASRVSKLRIVSLVATALAAVAVACSVHAPDRALGPSSSSPTSIAGGKSAVYFEFQIEKPATPMPGNAGPRYPDELREAKVEGEVLAQFVVDTLGRPEMTTYKVLKSSDDRFTQSVRGALGVMRFYPAEVGGRKVKQLIQMPFQFSLSKDK
jgi:TonB family protein